VLSEGFNPPDYSSLSEVAEDIDNGDASGEVTYDHTEVSKDTMRELLIAQGSDPEFLIIEDED
jgi:hypothetical protein